MAGKRIRRCPFCEEKIKPFVSYDERDKKYFFVHCCEIGNSASRVLVCLEAETERQ